MRSNELGWGRQVALVVATAVLTAVLVSPDLAGAFSVPNNSVNSAKIVNNSVASADIKNNTITFADLAPAAEPSWAHFRVDGPSSFTLVESRNAGSVGPSGAGAEVLFSNFVADCGLLATYTGTGAAQQGQIADISGTLAARQGAFGNTVIVEGFDGAGTVPLETDAHITVAALC